MATRKTSDRCNRTRIRKKNRQQQQQRLQNVVLVVDFLSKQNKYICIDLWKIT